MEFIFVLGGAVGFPDDNMDGIGYYVSLVRAEVRRNQRYDG
jgi:hypothetical protein